MRLDGGETTPVRCYLLVQVGARLQLPQQEASLAAPRGQVSRGLAEGIRGCVHAAPRLQQGAEAAARLKGSTGEAAAPPPIPLATHRTHPPRANSEPARLRCLLQPHLPHRGRLPELGEGTLAATAPAQRRQPAPHGRHGAPMGGEAAGGRPTAQPARPAGGGHGAAAPPHVPHGGC